MFVIDDIIAAAIAAAAEEAAAAAAATAATEAAATAATAGAAGAGAAATEAGAAGAAAGADAATASAWGSGAGLGGDTLGASGGLTQSMPTALSDPSIASQYLSPGSYSQPTGMGAWMGQNAPGVTNAMQQTGMLGNVVDATGGMETATTGANNVGGGMLGNSGSYGKQALQMAQLASKAMTSQPARAPQHFQPAQSPYANQPITPMQSPYGPSIEEQRKKRLMAAFGNQL